MKAHRTTLMLLLAAVVLAAVVVWDRSQVGTVEAEQRVQLLLDAWREKDINAIEIRSPTEQYVLERHKDQSADQNWKLKHNDLPARVDPQAASNFLITLEYARFLRPVSVDNSTVGLDTPALSIELSMGELRYGLRIGKAAPSPAGSRYVEVQGRAGGTRLYVISKELFDSMLENVKALRSGQLVPYIAVNLEKVQAHREGKIDWTLTAAPWGGRASGAFLVKTARGVTRASRRTLEAWFGKIGQFAAERLVEVPKVDAGDNRIRFEPRASASAAAEIEFVGDCERDGALVVRRRPDPLAGCVERKIADGVLVGSALLLDRHVVGARASDVSEIRLSDGDEVLELVRKGTGWNFRQPQAGPANGHASAALLDRLLKLEGTLLSVEEASDLEALGLGALARGQLTVKSISPKAASRVNSNERAEVVEVGKRQGDNVFVRRRDDGAVLRLLATTAEVLRPRSAGLRGAQIYDFPLKDVRGLALNCGGRNQRMRRDRAGAWTREQPVNTRLEIDMGLANELSDFVRRLEAVRWVADDDARDDYGLAKSWCEIEIQLDDGERRVRLGKQTRGGYFAQHDGQNAVFVAPYQLVRLADQWLLDRSALRLSPDDIAEVSIKGASGVSLHLTHQAGAWLRGTKAAPEGQEIASVLNGLVAESVIALGVSKKRSEPQLRVEVTVRDEGAAPVQFSVGKADLWRNTPILLVHSPVLKADFAVARSRLQPLLDVL